LPCLYAQGSISFNDDDDDEASFMISDFHCKCGFDVQVERCVYSTPVQYKYAETSLSTTR
jgi:hypothetical protein